MRNGIHQSCSVGFVFVHLKKDLVELFLLLLGFCREELIAGKRDIFLTAALGISLSKLFEKLDGQEDGREKDIPLACYEFLSAKSKEEQELIAGKRNIFLSAVLLTV